MKTTRTSLMSIAAAAVGVVVLWTPTDVHAQNPPRVHPDDPIQSLPREVQAQLGDKLGADTDNLTPDDSDPLRSVKDKENVARKVQRPEDRVPKIDVPHAYNNTTVPDQSATPKGSLVQVNKSGVTPQVLKKPKGAGSIQGMGLTFRTNLQTGSASLSLPISLPPARRGLGPDLSLDYSSSGSQGVCGLGWSFGVGFIARQTDQGLPIYNDDVDHFVYNGGRELVRVDPGNETLPTDLNVHPDYYFRAKIEGLFMRFFFINAGSSGAYWVAQDKDGTLYYFGGTENGVDSNALICGDNCIKIFRWNLVLVQDVHGNRVEYIYTKHGGQSYLAEVKYNNHPTESKYQHRVVVEYDDTVRGDVLTTYEPGFPVTTSRRIASISAFTDYGWVNGFQPHLTDGAGRQLVRRYHLTYVPGSLHSLLQTVTMCGKDDQTCLPPAEFEYAEVQGTHSVPGLGQLDGTVLELDESPGRSVGDGRWDLLDVDGDGLADLYGTDPTHPLGMPQYILNTGGSLPEGNVRQMAGGDQLMLWNTNVRLMDADGDGLSEMMHMPHVGDYKTYWTDCELPFSGNGALRECWWTQPEWKPAHPGIDLTTDAEEIRLVDINGDHLIDVVKTTGTQMQHWINLGRYVNAQGESAQGLFGHVEPDGTLSDQPITSCILYKGGYVLFSDPRVKFADVNGDGLQDIVLVDYGVFVYWPNKGFGQWGQGPYCPAGQTGSNRYIAMANAPFFSSMDPKKIYLGDINGDGLADMVQVRADNVDVWLNAVDHFKDRAIIDKSPWAPQFTDRVRMADMNGSGSRDILWGDGGNYRYMDLTGGIKPRVITRIHNGLGGITEIDYESSTQQYLRDRSDQERGEWNTVCPFPAHVVSQVRVKDNFDHPDLQAVGWSGSVYATKYRYRDCYYDGVEHEFRGFAETEEEKVGDANSPTNWVTHHFYQGKEDEALGGMEYRTDVWAIDPNSTSTPPARIYDSTNWTAFAIRRVKDPLAADRPPGIPLDTVYHRAPRFAYAAETHTFGYNTTEYAGGGHTRPGMLRVRFEGPAEPNAREESADVGLEPAASVTTHLKKATVVDDFGQTLEDIAYGQVGVDEVITTHTTYARKEGKWIHRACESWVKGQNDSPEILGYNHKRFYYDGDNGEWIETAPGQAQCSVGDRGLNSRGEFKIYFPNEPVRIVEEHHTDFTPLGLQRHTRAFKKMEEWIYYEDPRGYQALPTREVIRVGTDGPVPGENPGDPDRYPDTPVKYLTTRVSYDLGLGTIVEYRDANSQKTLVAYNALGWPSQIWNVHVPRSGCPTMQVPSVSYSYHLPQSSGDLGVQTSFPFSYVLAVISEDACDPARVLLSYSYLDGLGRERLEVEEGDEQPAELYHTEWIVEEFKAYDAKGAVQAELTPAFVSWVPGQDIPQPLEVWNCADDDSFNDSSICAKRTRYDPFGRIVEVVFEDETTAGTVYRGPLVEEQWDGVDNDPISPLRDTPRVIVEDGHGRKVRQTEIIVGPGQSGTQSVHADYSWNPTGSLKLLVQDSQGIGVQKEQQFDSVGQRRVLIDPDAGRWEFEYDDAGNLARTLDGNGNDIRYGYDAVGRVIWEDCVQSSVSTLCDPAGPEIKYFYDSPFRMVGGRGYMPEEVAAFNEGDPLSQDFVLGRFASVEHQTGQSIFSYDQRGRIAVEVQRVEADLGVLGVVGEGQYYVGRTVYDEQDRPSVKVYPDPDHLTVVVEYNNRGLISRIRGPEAVETDPEYVGYVSELVYNASGQVTSYAYQDGARAKTYRTYDRRRRLRLSRTVQVGGAGYTLADRRYTYDQVSNVTKIEDLRPYEQVAGLGGYAPDASPFDLALEYDSLYRLLKATYTDTDPQGHHVIREMRYGFDAVGNLVLRHTTDASGVQNPDHEFYDRWFHDGQYLPARPHALASAVGPSGQLVTADYDGNGNMTTLSIANPTTGRETVFAYVWDHYNRLVSVSGSESGAQYVSAEYRYDHLDLRTVKGQQKEPEPEELALYVCPVVEVRNNEVRKYILFGKERVARVDGQSRRFIFSDHLGSTNLVTSETGTVDSVMDYLPFGAVFRKAGPTDDPYKFTGKELEVDLGIYYFGARFYNPQLGRWLSVDPTELGDSSPEELDPYSYSGNNPVRLVDPEGTQPVDPHLQPFIRQFLKTFTWANIKEASRQAAESTLDVATKIPFVGSDLAAIMALGLGHKGKSLHVETGDRATRVRAQAARNLTISLGVPVALGMMFGPAAGAGAKFLAKTRVGKYVGKVAVKTAGKVKSAAKSLVKGAGARIQSRWRWLRRAVSRKRSTKGPTHHIMTNKNRVSTARGGPWTPRFEDMAKRAGMTLEDVANKIRIPGHRGPHPQAYHEAVFDRLRTATRGLEGDAYSAAFRAELEAIRTEASTAGSALNRLLTGQ